MANAIVIYRNKRIYQGLITGKPFDTIEGRKYSRKPRRENLNTKNSPPLNDKAEGKERKSNSEHRPQYILEDLPSELLAVRNAVVDEAKTIQHDNPQGGTEGANLFVNPYPISSSTPASGPDKAPLTSDGIISDSSCVPTISGEAQVLVRTVLHHQYEFVFRNHRLGRRGDDNESILQSLGEKYNAQKGKLQQEIAKSMGIEPDDSEMSEQVEIVVNDIFVDRESPLGIIGLGIAGI
jgi:hypothetical protein